MTDMGRRAGPGDMKKEDYDTNEDGVVDEVIAHKASHQDGGSDEVSVAGLSGALADEQLSSWAGVSGKPSAFTPSAHKASHQTGGSDELDLTGLLGAGGYIDRGDAQSWDWTLTDFSVENTWTDLDCASKVPAGASHIALRLLLTSDDLPARIDLRENGLSYEVTLSRCSVHVAAVQSCFFLVVACDADRKIEYKRNIASWTNLNVHILGWFG